MRRQRVQRRRSAIEGIAFFELGEQRLKEQKRMNSCSPVRKDVANSGDTASKTNGESLVCAVKAKTQPIDVPFHRHRLDLDDPFRFGVNGRHQHGTRNDGYYYGGENDGEDDDGTNDSGSSIGDDISHYDGRADSTLSVDDCSVTQSGCGGFFWRKNSMESGDGMTDSAADEKKQDVEEISKLLNHIDGVLQRMETNRNEQPAGTSSLGGKDEAMPEYFHGPAQVTG